MSYLIYAFLVYLLYRFIAGFILPVVRAASQVKKQFNGMRQQAEAQHAGQPNQSRSSMNGVDQKPKYDIDGEYIKFEEVKD